jgi:hypothetical protein
MELRQLSENLTQLQERIKHLLSSDAISFENSASILKPLNSDISKLFWAIENDHTIENVKKASDGLTTNLGDIRLFRDEMTDVETKELTDEIYILINTVNMELADSSQGTIPGQSTVSDHTVHSPELRC